MFRASGPGAAIVACAILGVAAFGNTAGAQTPRPSPTAAPTPVAFTVHAHGDITVVTQGATFNGSVQLGIAQRDALVRVDVLSVKSDTLPIPPIGLTAVIDHSGHTITFWNDATRQYRVQPFSFSFARGTPQPQPSASPRPPRRRSTPASRHGATAGRTRRCAPHPTGR